MILYMFSPSLYILSVIIIWLCRLKCRFRLVYSSPLWCNIVYIIDCLYSLLYYLRNILPSWTYDRATVLGKTNSRTDGLHVYSNGFRVPVFYETSRPGFTIMFSNEIETLSSFVICWLPFFCYFYKYRLFIFYCFFLFVFLIVGTAFNMQWETRRLSYIICLVFEFDSTSNRKQKKEQLFQFRVPVALTTLIPSIQVAY